MINPDSEKDISDTSPPIFKSWGRLYAIVFLNLIILILLFYFFTKAFE